MRPGRRRVAVSTVVSNVPFGQVTPFGFPWPIGAYVVGVTYFQYQFPGPSGHEVIEVALSLDANLTAADTVAVQPIGVMTDASGHNLDQQGSVVTAGVVAWSQDDLNVTAMSAPGVPSGTASGAVQIPAGSALLASQAVLGGFDIFRSDQHNVQYIRVSVSSNLFSPLAATVKGTAALQDASGNVDTSATVDLAYLCTYNVPELQLAAWAGPTQAPNGNQSPVNVQFAAPAANAAVFLTGFSIEDSDGSDMALGYIEAGANQVGVSGSAVNFVPHAAMTNGSKTSSTVATGWVSVVAVGIP
jgi:hypothetical protein